MFVVMFHRGYGSLHRILREEVFAKMRLIQGTQVFTDWLTVKGPWRSVQILLEPLSCSLVQYLVTEYRYGQSEGLVSEGYAAYPSSMSSI